MYKDLIATRKKDFDAAFDFAKNEAAAIRAGRASPAILEDIVVDYLGSRLKIKELGAITIPEPRTLQIQPWDKGAISAVEKAIRESELGLNPVSDSQAVRLTVPPLTEERRREFIRLLHQKVEEARIRARQVREDVLKRVQHEVKEKRGREDDVRHAKDDLQKIIDDLNRKFDELVKKKEAELMA